VSLIAIRIALLRETAKQQRYYDARDCAVVDAVQISAGLAGLPSPINST